MSVTKKMPPLSVEDYLEGEKHTQRKHEYVAGRVYAMVGASRAHNLIALSLASALRAHLRPRPCQVFASDMKVRIGDIFYYPDVVVNCDASDQEPYYCTSPVLIIEVLSPATITLDTIEKRVAYQSLVSLQEYVLVAQSHREVSIYRRTGQDWEIETHTEGDQVRLNSVGLTLPIEQIYEDVDVHGRR